MFFKKNHKNLDNNNQDTYVPHSIDTTIVRFLQRTDKGNFNAKEKIFFFKELAYLAIGGI
ncbi:MAG: hypothetical protein GXP45_00155 [bacterium]|nr:hypothetical protein [bacterium]